MRYLLCLALLLFSCGPVLPDEMTPTPVMEETGTPPVSRVDPGLWPVGGYAMRTETTYIISIDGEDAECELSPSAVVTVYPDGTMSGVLSLDAVPLESGESCVVSMPLLGGRDVDANPAHPCPGCSDYWRMEVSTPADLPCCGDDVAAWWSIYDRQYWGWDGGDNVWYAPGWDLSAEYFRPGFETVVSAQ